MFSKYEGDSELELTAIMELCARSSPSFLIIDDIDALSPSSVNTSLSLEVRHDDWQHPLPGDDEGDTNG
jgi:SpoVK/Ycf46/Vps4 family AAA+-type ATPase